MVVFFAMLMGAMALIAIPTSMQTVGQAQGAAYKVYGIINRIPAINSEDTGIANNCDSVTGIELNYRWHKEGHNIWNYRIQECCVSLPHTTRCANFKRSFA